MRKTFDANAYLEAREDGKEIIEFCDKNNIKNYSVLITSSEMFPEEKRERWFKRICSPGFIRFLHSKGIK